MKTRTQFAFFLHAISAALALTTSAFAASEVNANVELDNTVRQGSAVAENDRGLGQGGRVEVNISGKAGDHGFVAGRTSLIAKQDGSVGTDDMWVQVGTATADIKLGRFEAADLFPLNGDTLVNHAGNVYTTNNLRGRVGAGAFQAAGTFNLGGGTSLEVSYIDATKTAMANGVSAKGVRAVLSMGSGPWSGRIGMESGEFVATAPGLATNRVAGWGATGTYDAGSFKLTGNYSQGQQNTASDNRESAMGLSLGMGNFGAGYVNAVTNQAGGDIKVNTVYAAYGIPLFGIKGATLTPAISHSSAANSVTGNTTQEDALRVRIHYDF